MVDPTGIVQKVADPVVEWALDNVKKRVSYVCNCRGHLERFKHLHKELTDSYADIKKKVEQGEISKNEEVSETVRSWLVYAREQLESQTNEELLMDEDDRKVDDRWCFGFIGCNPNYRHHLSRVAEEKSDYMDKLLRKVSDLRLTPLTHSAGPPGFGMFRGNFHVGLQSREKVVQEIMDLLKKDDTVNRIGISGMGGAGKTTLVEEIARRAEMESFFKKVFIADITRSPNVKLIQERIAERIGLSLHDVHDERERALRLNESLKKMRRREIGSNEPISDERSGKLLLILDNVWGQVELQALGICHELETDSKCVIIVTSRIRDVCKQIGTVDSNIYEVGDLTAAEAKLLFEEKVGPNTTATSQEYKDIMESVLNKCSLLPLSISVLADRLRNQSLDVWKDIIRRLDKSKHESGSTTSNTGGGVFYTIYSIIEQSYNYIKSEDEKLFFLLCCIFQPSERVLIWDLLKYGIGWGFFQRVNSLAEAIHQAREWLDDLLFSSLLLEVNYCTGEIKIHDDVREAGKSIAAKEEKPFHVGACSSWFLEETLKNYSVIVSSSGHNYLKDLDLHGLLLLQIRGSILSDLQDNYFKRMQNVKILDLSESTIESLPSSIKYLSTLRTFVLDNCFNLRDIAQVCKLCKLQVFSLKGSNIQILPKEIGNMVSLKLLDLTSCEKIKEIPAGALARLTLLEGLLMRDSFNDWQINGDMASVAELQSLPLKVLEVDITSSAKQLSKDDFVIHNMSFFGIRIGIGIGNGKTSINNCSFSTHDVLSSSRFSVARANARDLEKEGCIALWKNTEGLYLEKVDGLKQVVSISDGYWPSKLRTIEVVRCHNMDCLIKEIAIKDVAIHSILPNLQEVILYDLPDLHSYVLPTQSAMKLKVIRVSKCGKLKYILSENTTFKNFPREEANPNDEIKLPELQELVIEDLPLFESFCCQTNEANNTSGALFTKKIKVSGLEILRLNGIPKLKHVWDDEFLKANNESINVKELGITECCSMESLCPISMENAFQRLRNLYIKGCEKMKQVISAEVGYDYEDGRRRRIINGDGTLSFSNLLVIKLKNLSNLMCFYLGSLKMEFPCLRALKLLELKRFEYFARSGHSSNQKPKGTTTVKTLFPVNSKVLLPSLVHLKLRNLDEIEMLWDTTTSIASEESPRLHKLKVSNMPKLRHVFKGIMSNNQIESLKRIEMRSCKVVENLISQLQVGYPSDVLDFSALQWLILEDLESFKCICNKSSKKTIKFPVLEGMHIKELPLIEVLVLKQEKGAGAGSRGELNIRHHEDDEETISLFEGEAEFSSLDKLIVDGVFELEGVFNGKHLPQAMLQNLTSLSVCWLGGLRCLLSTNILSALKRLETLYVGYCDSLEELYHVVDHEEGEHGAYELLPKLKKLTICSLPKLKNMPWRILRNLQILRIVDCFKRDIKFLIPSVRVIQGVPVSLLQELRELETRGCNGIEAIVGDDDIIIIDADHHATNNNIEGVIQFPKLVRISLVRMKGLVSFISASQGYNKVDLPSLQALSIQRCLNMRSFDQKATLTISAPSIKSVNIDMKEIFQPIINSANIGSVGDLQSTLQRQFNEQKEVRLFWPKRLKHRSHPHELRLARVRIRKQKCDRCDLPLKWKRAFCCGNCSFYICTSCAEEEAQTHLDDEARLEIEVAKSWPATLKHIQHKHELKLLFARRWDCFCDDCRHQILDLYAFSCEKCNFDLHPECAMEELRVAKESTPYPHDETKCKSVIHVDVHTALVPSDCGSVGNWLLSPPHARITREDSMPDLVNEGEPSEENFDSRIN